MEFSLCDLELVLDQEPWVVFGDWKYRKEMKKRQASLRY